MTIFEIEEQLFRDWQENRDGFVRDGVVSETDYSNSNPKIAFIFKEVNGCLLDLREFLSKGGRSQTWNNVARWVHGVRNLESLPNWASYPEITNEFRTETLKSICVINLKKSPGTHTTNNASLNAVANEDKEYIRRQYSIYDPGLTICGGTGDLFKSVAGHESYKWNITERGIWWYARDTDKYVVHFSHPEARVHSPLLVYGLLDAIKEICA